MGNLLCVNDDRSSTTSDPVTRSLKTEDNKIDDALLAMTSKNPEECDINAFKEIVETHQEDLTKDIEYKGESDVSPLHLAVLTSASPDVVEAIISVDGMIEKQTSFKRTALEIAKEIVHDKECTEESSTEVKNAFAAVEMLEATTNALEKRRKLSETVRMATQYLETIDEDDKENFDSKAAWGKLKMTVIFANHLLKNHSLLGPRVAKDSFPAVCPEGFKVPSSLERETVNLVLPVGLNRLKCALLSDSSDFMEKEFYEEKLRYTEIKVGGWDKFNEYIGKHTLPEDVKEEDFIGAEKKHQVKMPKTMLVSANTAYGTTRLIAYNDYCFALKYVTKNPEVPYGKTFEAHTQRIFVNEGNYRCRMICSMQTVFPKSKPIVAWKIKNGMFSGCSDSDVALGELVCAHAGNA